MNGEIGKALRSRMSALPGRASQAKFAPEIGYGRHFGLTSVGVRKAAVLALVYPSGDDWMVPLTVRPLDMPDHPGQVCLPGGMVEPGEGSLAAALREFAEEMGVFPANFSVLGPLTEIHIFNSNFLVTPWLAVCGQSPEYSPNNEVADWFELPLTAIHNIGLHDSMEVVRGHLRFVAPCIRWNQHCIWGATLMMLAELSDLVRPTCVELRSF